MEGASGIVMALLLLSMAVSNLGRDGRPTPKSLAALLIVGSCVVFACTILLILDSFGYTGPLDWLFSWVGL